MNPSIALHLADARAALIEARRLAQADAADATFQLAHGRLMPLPQAVATATRIHDLIHLTTRLMGRHGVD